MKVFSVIAKIIAVLSAVIGAVYVLATYGDKIVAWCKNLIDSLPECSFCDDDDDDIDEDEDDEDEDEDDVLIEIEVPEDEDYEDTLQDLLNVDGIDEDAPADPVAEDIDFE